MSLEGFLLAIRLSPLLFVPLIPLREYVPYSVDRTEIQAKMAEAHARTLLLLTPPVTQTDLYLAGEIPWHKYDEDLALIRRQIDRCRQNSFATNAKIRHLGCWIQRGKLRTKLGLISMAKSMIGFSSNVIQGVRAPGGFFYLLQLVVIAAGFGAGVRWCWQNGLPTLIDIASQYLPAAPEPEKVVTKPFIARQRSATDLSPVRSDREPSRVSSSPLPSRGVDSELDDCSETNVTKSHVGRGHLNSRFAGDLLSSSEECLSASDIARDSPRDQTKKDSPRGIMSMGMYDDENTDLPSADTSVSSPSLDRQSSPVRAKKRVAFQVEDRLPRAGPSGSAPSGISRGRASYGMSSSIVPPSATSISSSPSGSPTRSGARSTSIRGRQTASLGRVQTGV